MSITYEQVLALFQETDRKFQETDRQLRETAKKVEQVTQSIGELGGRLEPFVEASVRPAAVRLFRERGIEVHEVHQNVSVQRGDDGLEIDLLVINGTDLVGIECKSHLCTQDVDDHLERLAKLKTLLPSYADRRVLGAVAAMVLPDDVAKYAYRKGLYVIAQSGEQLKIRNDLKFKPHIW